MHRENIIYLNDVPQGFQSHDQWLKECNNHLAIWCQNQALDIALQHLAINDLYIVTETCADIIDHVEHCSRLIWSDGYTGEPPRKIQTLNLHILTQRVDYSEIFYLYRQVWLWKTVLNTLFEYSEQWLGEIVSQQIEDWIHKHPNTTNSIDGCGGDCITTATHQIQTGPLIWLLWNQAGCRRRSS